MDAKRQLYRAIDIVTLILCSYIGSVTGYTEVSKNRERT